jgi:hypothetical protein
MGMYKYNIHENANLAILGQAPKLAVFQDRPIIRWLTRLKYHRHRYNRTLHERIWLELNWQRTQVLSDACSCRRRTEIEAHIAFFLEPFDSLAVRSAADALEVAAMHNRSCEHQRSRKQ